MSVKKPAGIIIGTRKDGLGARLLLMLNCIKISQQFDAHPAIYWPREDSLAVNMENPENLFSDNMLRDYFLSKREFEKLGRAAVPLWKFLSDKGPNRLKKHLQSGGNVLVEEGFEIVLFPWEDDATVRAKYRSYFDMIETTDVLQDRCAQIDQVIEQGQSGSVAYHLRRGDILDTAPWKHTVWPSKVEPDEYYEAHLRKSEGKAAIIFSDSAASITRLKQQFPQIKAIEDIVSLDDIEPEQRDFLELYAMSRVDDIIAPTLSAFSTAAARISGRQRLRFREVLSDEEIGDANQRGIERLYREPKSFINASEMAHAFSRFAVDLAEPEQLRKAEKILYTAQKTGATNAFVNIYQATTHLYQEKWGDAAGYARLAACSDNIWPEDFASAKAIEAVSYAATGQRRKAGCTFREAFLFKPLRQDVVLAGTNLSLKHMLNRHNFVPFDHKLLRQLRLRANEDRSSAYLIGKIINKRLRRDFRYVALDWYDLVLDGKASRLRNDKTELRRMLDRLQRLPNDFVDENVGAYRSTEAQILAYLDESNARQLSEGAIEVAPDNALWIMRLANVLVHNGDLKAATSVAREAFKRAPENPFYAHKLALLESSIGHRDQAVELLKTAAASENATAKVLADFAMLAFRMGQRQLARTHMERAIALIPVYGRFQNQLKRMNGGKSRD